MPYLKINTNCELDCDGELELANTVSAALSSMLGKPENYIMIEVHSDLSMMFAGSSDPLAYLELKSIGLPEKETGAFSMQLCHLIATQLDIRNDRVYIEFSPVERHLWGWNNSTF